MEINLQTLLSIPHSPIYNVGRSFQVFRTLLSPANIDLVCVCVWGGGGGGGGEGEEIVTNMSNEKYIIFLEVFKNLTLFLKSLWIILHDCIKNLDTVIFPR